MDFFFSFLINIEKILESNLNRGKFTNEITSFLNFPKYVSTISNSCCMTTKRKMWKEQPSVLAW